MPPLPSGARPHTPAKSKTDSFHTYNPLSAEPGPWRENQTWGALDTQHDPPLDATHLPPT